MNSGSARRRRDLVILALLALLMLLAILFTPDDAVSDQSPRLTSHSREPNGARGFAETAQKLGWSVTRHERAMLPAARHDVVYAVLAPSIPLTAAETHGLLQRVRDGAALYAVLAGRSLLADSLGVRFRGRFGRVPDDTTARCAPTSRRRALEALRGLVYSAAFDVAPPDGARTLPFLTLEAGSAGRQDTLVAAVGFQLGSGRVGLVADPDLLTNSVFRRCRLEAGVSSVQLLKYVAAGADGARHRSILLFDEYHHGFGRQPSITRVTMRFVRDNPIGRMLGQVSLAGLVLVLAVGTRPATPAPPDDAPRRSPLEHARALSLAYAQISATRTVARLLLRGVRRRLSFSEAARARTLTDEEFLEHLATRYPSLQEQVALLRRALGERLPKQQVAAVGRAITTIERTVNREIH